MTESGTPRRVFLGWERAPLRAAAEWLHAERGSDLGELFVALPGARAGRALAAQLAHVAGPSAVPPRILTAGALTDELIELEAEPAGRLARTLAWAEALRGLPRAELAPLVAEAPEELPGWLRLAEEVRRLFGELAAGGLSFRAVAARQREPSTEAERARWRALAAAETRMTRILDEAGALDPHLGRLAALEAGGVEARAEVALVGVADMNALQRRALAQLGARVTALVFAPEELAESFDELGCLRVDAWRERELRLPLERWQVADDPREQAEALARILADWNGAYAADEIAVGALDPELAPYLRRRLASEGIAVRDAAGTPFARTAPARLVEALARFLRGRGLAELAELLRHPDLETALRARKRLAGLEPAALLDAYRTQHLAQSADGRWLGSASMRAELEALSASLAALLGELDSGEQRPIARWAEPARAFLVAVYGALPASGADGTSGADGDAQHARDAALALLGSALSELAELPDAIAPPALAAEALAFLAHALRGTTVPPPHSSDAPAIELLGWLELPLDESPALVVIGFQDGRVPEAVHGDAFLPDGLRRSLGLVDNDARLARDVYAAQLLLCSGREVHFVSGRRSASNDPLLPSRLAFLAPDEEIPRRVRHFLPAAEGRRAPPEDAPEVTPTRRLPRREPLELPETFAVTSFSAYLRSPYLFYLERTLGLETVDDRRREMDPRSFGSLAHEVLEVLGKSELCDSTDAEAVAELLTAELSRRARERFGPDPLPAVALQIEQLQWRLAHFAPRHAERAASGWRVVHAEWSPAEGGVPFDVDGAPVLLRGKIDRIERHEEHGFAIFDYKAGDEPERPDKAHRARDGAWRDLQLPLYCLLAAELEIEALPRVGYATLGKDPAAIGFFELRRWSEADLESALEAAREVVRKVRRGELFDVGRGKPREPVLQALVGQGLFSARLADGDGAAEGDDRQGEGDGEQGGAA